MLGGVMGGYCATGKLNTATRPARTITIDKTDANIGRRIKKCENIKALSFRPQRQLRLRHRSRQPPFSRYPGERAADAIDHLDSAFFSRTRIMGFSGGA